MHYKAQSELGANHKQSECSTTASKHSHLRYIVLGLIAALAPRASASSYILLPVNSPTCWQNATFERGNLNDQDLLANLYETLVTIRPNNDPQGTTIPGSNVGQPVSNNAGQAIPGAVSATNGWCINTGTTFRYFQFDASGSNLMYFEYCSDSTCSNGCVQTATVPFPLLSKSDVCSPTYYVSEPDVTNIR